MLCAGYEDGGVDACSVSRYSVYCGVAITVLTAPFKWLALVSLQQSNAQMWMNFHSLINSIFKGNI